MDYQQPNIHSGPGRFTGHLSLILVLAGLLAACNLPSNTSELELDQVVGATLTAVAQEATSTNTLAPAPPTEPAATQVPATQAQPTAIPQPTTSPGSGQTEEAEDGVPGVISGSLSYPSEQIPRLAVVFFNLDDGSWWWIGTAVNQSSYQMTVPVGRYQVVAYAEGGLAGGYTAAVPCGLTVACTDHSLLTVEVGSNEQVNGIHATDWYAPPGTFPAKPGAINYP